MTDVLKDFKTEVAQNRPRMALQELVPFLESLENQIAVLTAKVDSMSQDTNPPEQVTAPEPAVKKAAPKKKAPAKKSAATKQENVTED